LAGLYLPKYFLAVANSIQNNARQGGIGLGVGPTIEVTIPLNVPPLDGDEA